MPTVLHEMGPDFSKILLYYTQGLLVFLILKESAQEYCGQQLFLTGIQCIYHLYMFLKDINQTYYVPTAAFHVCIYIYIYMYFMYVFHFIYICIYVNI
jgi:hypothetical protein